jgi:excisionase family DNA binding protein
MENGELGFDLLTLSEVAKLLHCSKAHVGKVVAGQVDGCRPIPSLHLGRRTLIRRSALLRWIEQNEMNANLSVLPEWGAGRRA